MGSSCSHVTLGGRGRGRRRRRRLAFAAAGDDDGRRFNPGAGGAEGIAPSRALESGGGVGGRYPRLVAVRASLRSSPCFRSASAIIVGMVCPCCPLDGM